MNTQHKSFLGLKVFKGAKEGKYLGLVGGAVVPSDEEVSWKLLDSGAGDSYFMTQAADPQTMIALAPPKRGRHELLFTKDATATWAITRGKDPTRYFIYTKTGAEQTTVFLTMDRGRVYGQSYNSGVGKKSFDFGDGDDDGRMAEDGRPEEPKKGQEPLKGQDGPKDEPKPKDPKAPSSPRDLSMRTAVWEITDGRQGST